MKKMDNIIIKNKKVFVKPVTKCNMVMKPKKGKGSYDRKSYKIVP